MSGLDTIISQLASASVEGDKEVTFSGKGLKLDTEEDAQDVVNAIKNCPGMTALRLDGNTIGIQAAKAIAKALEGQPHFKKAFWKDMFTQRTEHEIPDALNYLSSGIILAKSQLVVLDLSDNAFGPRGLKGIVNLLRSSPTYTLQELYLNNNGLGIAGAKMLAGALLQCLSQSRKDGHPLSLKVFVCGRNRLENEGSLALSEFLKGVGTLEHVAMPQNGISHPGIAGISEALAANPDLKMVNLEDNSLTEKGAGHIAKQLPLLNNLEVLNLGDCLIRTKGAKIIGDSLQYSCPKLRELLLGFNEIQKDGGIAIVKGIENKTSLKKLVLNGNQFGSSGCDLIQEMMEALDKSEQLASLSEDEGSDEEDEEEGASSEDEEEEDEPEDDTESCRQMNGSLGKSPLNRTQVSFSDFLDNPSSEKLLALHESKESAFKALREKPSPSDYFDLFVQLASVVKPSDQKTCKAASHYADELLSAAFKLANRGEMWKFNNDFVVALRLIKSEEKKLSKPEDLTGVFTVLQHCVCQPYFDESTKTLLQFFLSQPLRLGKASVQSVSGLSQCLYQS